MKKVYVSDAALKVAAARSGEFYTFREKLEIARYIAGIRADAIELPLLKKEKEDSLVYKTICSAVGETAIKIDAGTTDDSARLAAEAIKTAKNKCMQIVLPVSTVQMEYGFHKKSAAMLTFIAERVAVAKSLCKEVEFVAADASRTDADFLAETLAAAVSSGATAVVVSDDAGTWLPEEAAEVFAKITGAVNVPVYVKSSDKIGLGLAVASAAIKAGAVGIVTSSLPWDGVNTAAFAELVSVKGENLGASVSIDGTAIRRDAEIIAKKDKPSGKATESGVKIRITEESTLSDVAEAVSALGYDVSEADNGKIYEEAKRILKKKSVIESRELEVIVAAAAMQAPSSYHLESYVVNCGNVINATAQITLYDDTGKLGGVGMGDGPIDAAFKVIEQIIGHHYELDDFQIQTVTEGRESVGHALVKLRHNGKLFSGNGVSTDIVGASVRAYLNALNKIIAEAGK